VEASVAGWAAGEPAGAETALLEYATADGSTGRVSFHEAGGVHGAAVSTVPGIAWRLAGPPPPVPGPS